MSAALVPSDNILLLTAGIAAGSLLLAGVGLIVAYLASRHLPLRHGLLLTTLLLVLALPMLTPAAAVCGLGWRMTYLSHDLPAASHPEPPLLDGVASSESDTWLETSPSQFNADEGAFDSVELPPSAPVWNEVPASDSIERELGSERSALVESQSAIEAVPNPPEQVDAPVVVETARTPVSSPADPYRSVGSALLALWVLGGMVSLLRGGMAAVRLRRLMRRASLVHDVRLVPLLEQTACESGLREIPRLLAADDIPVPFVYGLRRSTVCLPSHLLGESTQALHAILLHELAHIRRRDLLVGRVQRIAAAVYWWNPLVHRLSARLDEAREDLCDNHVLRHTGDPHGYANLLIETASRAVGASVVPSIGLFSRRPAPFSQRINRLLQEDRSMSTSLGRITRVLLVVFAFVLGVGSTLFVVLREDLRTSIGIDTSSSRAEIVDVQLPMLVETVSYPENYGSPAVRANVDSRAVESLDFVEAVAGEDLTFADSPSNPGFDAFPESGDAAPADSPATPIPSINPPPASDFEPFAAQPGADSFAPADAAPVPISPHDMDASGFGSPWTPEGAIPSAEAVRQVQSGLVILRLVGNEDGSLKELHYLTDDLGNDDAAFETLKQRIEEYSKQSVTRLVPSRDDQGVVTYTKETVSEFARPTEVQIVADPSLRYEHVARVVAICEPYVNRVSFARAESEQQLEISIGFVRDAQGRRIVDQPVVFVGETLVQQHEVQAALSRWSSVNQQVIAEGVTIVIRADAGVDYKVVEEIVQAAQQAGFNRFALRSLEQSPQKPTGKIERLIEVDEGGVVRVEVSLGIDKGIRPGATLVARPPEDPAGKESANCVGLEVVEVKAASSICRVVSGSPGVPEVGFLVAPYGDTEPSDAPEAESPRY